MRFDAGDARPYSHHVKLPPDRPVFGGLHQRPADATSASIDPDDQPDDFSALTRLQQQPSLSGNPPDDARGLLGYDDEARICAQEHIEPLSNLIDRRWIPEFRRKASDRWSVVERSGTKFEIGAQIATW